MKKTNSLIASILILVAFVAVTLVGNSCRNSKQKMETEKTINVKEVSFSNSQPAIAEVDSMFNNENIEFHPIDVVNWEGYNYNPQVHFRIAYSTDEIYLQYRVKESCVKAVYGEDEGSSPYKDSCVEFFCVPDPEHGAYYNLELNCIAKGTFAGGRVRTERTHYGDDILSQIRRASTLDSEAFGVKESDGEPFEYTITIALPVKLFTLSEIKPLKGRTIKANFYKCGDDMPQPHYFSWNPIKTEKPNFHKPEFFGNIHFE